MRASASMASFVLLLLATAGLTSAHAGSSEAATTSSAPSAYLIENSGPEFPGLDPGFAVFPPLPDPDDVIGFQEQFETVLYYTCSWEYPVPRLSVHHDEKFINFMIDYPDYPAAGGSVIGCGQIVTPVYVNGVEGTFGALEPGLWEYRSELSAKTYSFTVVPEPDLISLATVVAAGLLVRQRRRTGRGHGGRGETEPARHVMHPALQPLESRRLLAAGRPAATGG